MITTTPLKTDLRLIPGGDQTTPITRKVTRHDKDGVKEEAALDSFVLAEELANAGEDELSKLHAQVAGLYRMRFGDEARDLKRQSFVALEETLMHLKLHDSPLYRSAARSLAILEIESYRLAMAHHALTNVAEDTVSGQTRTSHRFLSEIPAEELNP